MRLWLILDNSGDIRTRSGKIFAAISMAPILLVTIRRINQLDIPCGEFPLGKNPLRLNFVKSTLITLDMNHSNLLIVFAAACASWSIGL